MSTVKKPLKYLWTAHLEDGTVIEQPMDDRYSKHDDTKEWNPSAFRDILDKTDEGVQVELFTLQGDGAAHIVNLVHGIFMIDGTAVKLEHDCESPRKLIYYRTVEKDYVDGEEQDERIVSYSFGYEYKDVKGKTKKAVVTLND